MAAGNKALEVTLGVVTSVGGFLEIGSIATAGQAGALFGFRLVWAVALGGICVAFLVEQAGRLAAASGLPIAAAIRERFGSTYYFLLLAFMVPVTLLTLGASWAACASRSSLPPASDCAGGCCPSCSSHGSSCGRASSR